jgi:uncharacterized protein (TIGR03032 family)
MSTPSQEELDHLWARHHAEWRDPAQITSQWEEAAATEPKLLRHKARGDWWDVLEDCGITLLVTREYEHLVIAMHACGGKPVVTYQRLPHPSGLTIDRTRGVIHVASTRNPNQIYDFMPVTGMMQRLDVRVDELTDRPLVPVRSRFFPGCLYMHDLAMIGDTLYANSVGQNAIVRFDASGNFERVWWPLCIETEAGIVFGQNHLQLNSIAAGIDLESSFFSASLDKISARRPGHKNFPVDKRGVIFSGKTRDVAVRGLTRPHSARLHNGQVWVDNSGYGELGFGVDGRFQPVIKLPGWTRGLCFYNQIAFVGTSRVIPRFRQYAPGLDVDSSLCGVHAVDIQSGKVLGSLLWAYGNQIFAVDWVPHSFTTGFPFTAGAKRAPDRDKKFFYAFKKGDS